MTNILKLIMEEFNFPWFEKVTTLKCYMMRNVKDKDTVETFFTRFTNIQMFKGIIDDDFFPLNKFSEVPLKIPGIKWTIPTEDHLREKFLNFLEFNET